MRVRPLLLRDVLLLTIGLCMGASRVAAVGDFLDRLFGKGK